jgi:hypothetical protein
MDAWIEECIEKEYLKNIDKLKGSNYFGQPINFDNPHLIACAFYSLGKSEGHKIFTEYVDMQKLFDKVKSKYG